MEDEQATRQKHLVPEAIRAIRVELMQKKPQRPTRQLSGDDARVKKPAPANRAG